jgi:hypothetical protein
MSQQRPAMQMPFMQNQFMGSPMMDSGCDCGVGGDCDCGGGMGGMMEGADMMQGSGFPDMNSEPGCCGSDGGMMQQNYEPATPAIPQSTMMMSPGSMTMSRMQMSRMSMGQPGSIAPYSSMSRWYSNPGYTPQFSNPAYSRSTMIRSWLCNGHGRTDAGPQLPKQRCDDASTAFNCLAGCSVATATNANGPHAACAADEDRSDAAT